VWGDYKSIASRCEQSISTALDSLRRLFFVIVCAYFDQQVRSALLPVRNTSPQMLATEILHLKSSCNLEKYICLLKALRCYILHLHQMIHLTFYRCKNRILWRICIFIPQFRKIHFASLTNAFCVLNKCSLIFGQMHFDIQYCLYTIMSRSPF